jgi:hypothetical protein
MGSVRQSRKNAMRTLPITIMQVIGTKASWNDGAS